MFSLDHQPWWLRMATLPLAGVFAVVVALRALLYHLRILPRRKLGVPVVSVGNIAVGGTGKSPVVMALAESLIEAGKRPGILTRGYGRKAARNDALILLSGKILHTNSPTLLPGDEAMMESVLLPKVPVVQCRSRYFGGKFAEKSGTKVDMWLLDDGFQHWALQRDFDVVLIDGEDKGSKSLLPAGRLRESPAALQRANFVLFTRTYASERWPVANLQRGVAQFTVGWPTTLDGHTLPQDARPALVSGIARPERLRTDLEKLGCHLAAEYLVSDHAALVLPPTDAPIVTTAKDYYRNPGIFAKHQVYIVPLNVKLPKALVSEILRVVFPQPSKIL